MAIPTNPKPTIYRNVYEDTAPVSKSNNQVNSIAN